MKQFLIFMFLLILTLTNAIIINIPTDQPTIQAGIDVVDNADTVLVQPGTYLENINYNGKNITVASLFLTTQDSFYIEQTIIDGDQNGSVVTFESGEDLTAVLRGFTITNGYSITSGGGIGCVNTSYPRLNNLIILGNYAEYNGGGILIGAFSSPSLENVIITGNSAGSSGGGIYCFNNCSPSLENVTISNNDALHGGGISCFENSSPSLENVIITNNSATSGGGGLLCVLDSNMNLQDVTISGNTAVDEGGGIYIEDSDLTLNNVNIEDNVGEIGGGIYFYNSNPTLNNVIISGNSSMAGGGVCFEGSSPTLDNVIITSNEATAIGGGLLCIEYSNPSLMNVMISDNIVLNTDGWAGGICCMTYSSPSLEHVTIANNSGDVGGGMLCMEYSNPTLENVIIRCNSAYIGGGINCSLDSNPDLINVLIIDNSAVSMGGGISCYDADPNLVNVTISDNTANEGSGIYCREDANVNLINCILWNSLPFEIYFDVDGLPNSITISYSDIQDGETGIETNNNGTVNWLEGNINEDPLFMGTGANPYVLNNMSPCVNAGTPDLTGLNLPEFDLIGNPRVFGGRIDMGAYENQNVVVNAKNDLIPLITNLDQNYPNPFNPTTTISFSIPEESNVELSIYNIKGQKIKSLLSDQISAGEYSIVWNGEDTFGKKVSSGIYFYKLTTTNASHTKKMLLIK